MLPIKSIRENPRFFQEALKSRGYEFDIEAFMALDQEVKQINQSLQALQEKRNAQSKRIGQMKAKGEDAADAIASMHAVNEEMKAFEKQSAEIESKREAWLMEMPNVPHESAPMGQSEKDNVVVSQYGNIPSFSFEVKDHIDLAEALGGMHFDRASNVSGARFCYLTGAVAKLHRALSQYMLDFHIEHHGYTEVNVPTLVLDDAMYGSGQFPKFKEEAYRIEADGLSLIPTAEVPLVNWVNQQVVSVKDLPIRFVSHSLCYRREAGSYGQDTRGMIRMHQFEKVELVQCVAPDSSLQALENMREHAEAILQSLNLPYQVIELCRGDLGFCAVKTYDLEVWLPSQNAYREISSVSHCMDFQARRLKARFKQKEGKLAHLHTLNGSGVAVGRCLIALLENNQDEHGQVHIPQALQPYFGSDILKVI